MPVTAGQTHGTSPREASAGRDGCKVTAHIEDEREVSVFHIRVVRTLGRPATEVFAALSDHGGYARFPGITAASLLEPGTDTPNGVGALRRIQAGPVTFLERITRFEPGRRFDYRIERCTPLPMRHEGGSVQLEGLTGDQTRVTWTSDGRSAVPLLGRFLDGWLERQGAQGFASILKALDG